MSTQGARSPGSRSSRQSCIASTAGIFPPPNFSCNRRNKSWSVIANLTRALVRSRDGTESTAFAPSSVSFSSGALWFPEVIPYFADAVMRSFVVRLFGKGIFSSRVSRFVGWPAPIRAIPSPIRSACSNGITGYGFIPRLRPLRALAFGAAFAFLFFLFLAVFSVSGFGSDSAGASVIAPVFPQRLGTQFYCRVRLGQE